MLDKKSPIALNHLGRVYAAKRDFASSAAAFNKALAINPDYFEANFNLGNLYYHKKDWPASLRCYRRALKLRPKDDFVLFKMAKIYE